MRRLTFVVIFTQCLFLCSCFKSEPKNTECDIETAWLHVADPQSFFYNYSDSLVKVKSTSDEIIFSVCEGADISSLAPQFTITEGAKIFPESGSVHDFSQGSVTYSVTSQDGAWKRIYEVAVDNRGNQPVDSLFFNFESFRLKENKNYYEWVEVDSAGNETKLWDTSNEGFSLSSSTAGPFDYPASPSNEGFLGNCLKLTTRSTGPFGEMVGRRLAAGSAFIGEFDVTYALTETLKCPHFGFSITTVPQKLSGYYKYTPGEVFQDKDGNPMPDMVDEGAIYAVFYDNHDENNNPIVLYGDNIFESPYHVAMARLPKVETTDEWTYFEVDFDFYKDVDLIKLLNRGYSFTIVCSSSKGGDYFEGAVGSTLLVDNIKLCCNNF